jgi:predicted RND superfamily exporter protein
VPTLDPTDFLIGACAAFAALLALVVFRPLWCVAHPRTTLGTAVAVTLVAAALVVRSDPPGFRIALDPSSEPLLVRGDPGRALYDRAVLAFGSDDLCVIAMETADVFREANLRALERVTDALRRLRGVRDAESLVNATAFHYDAEGDLVEVGRFVHAIPSDAGELERLRARALSDPLFARLLVAPDARAAAIHVTFETLTDREFVGRGLDAAIQDVLRAETTPERRFFVTGRPLIRAAAHHLMVRDLLRLIPVAIGVAALAVALVTGSPRGVLVPLVTCLTATLWTFGAMAALGRDLNVITLVVGPCLIVIASVYGVYVVERYDEVALSAPDGVAAAARALLDTRPAIVISGLTTIVGFLAQLANGIPATTELGLFCAFGLGCATVLSATAVPAWLALLSGGRSGAAVERLWQERNPLARWLGARIDALLERIWAVETRRPRVFLAAWVFVAAGAALLVPRIVIDTDYLTFFDPRSEVRTDFDAVNRLLGGTVPLYVVFEGGANGFFREPEALARIDRIERRIEALPGVSDVRSMADLVRSVNRAFAGGDPGGERIPATRAELAELIFTIPKERLRRFATADHSAANLIVRTDRMGSAAVRELEDGIRAELADGAAPPGVPAHVTGNTLLVNHSADGIAANQLGSLALATAAIALLVFAVFRDWKLTLIALTPNVVPVLLFYGILGAGAAPLSIPTSLIGTIVLGIAVDDTVHFLSGYRRERAAGRSPEEATRLCLRHVGRAMVIASVMLSVGFNVMNLSEFATLRQFGYLSGATLAVCIVTDLGLLPALLVAAKV